MQRKAAGEITRGGARTGEGKNIGTEIVRCGLLSAPWMGGLNTRNDNAMQAVSKGEYGKSALI